MKSKKIDKLRYEDYNGVEVLNGFFVVLEKLGIKSASAEADETQYLLDEEFCGDCKITKDDCDCRGQHDCDWENDGDRAYDAWKDAQLEDEHNQG